jgi:hypothetical protein
LRRRMRGEGLTPPPLPAELAHIDQEQSRRRPVERRPESTS